MSKNEDQYTEELEKLKNKNNNSVEDYSRLQGDLADRQRQLQDLHEGIQEKHIEAQTEYKGNNLVLIILIQFVKKMKPEQVSFGQNIF